MIQSHNGWEFLWRKDSNRESTGAATKTINSVKVSDGGEYKCRARRGRYYTERPKSKVTIKPAQHVFRGDTVTLRCDIYGEGVTSWSYSWYKEGSASVFSDQQEHTFSSVNESDAGKYSCKGSETEGSRWSQMSDAVTLTVSESCYGVENPNASFNKRCRHNRQSQNNKQTQVIADNEFLDRGNLGNGVRDFPTPILTAVPRYSLFTGDSVTLRCEMIQSHNGWEFLWTKDSNRESTGAATKTINSVKVSDGGEYRCRARRGGYYTERPKPKVTIKPAQHVFRGDTVTLRCDIYGEGVTSWSYSWYKEGSTSVFSDRQELTFSSVNESNAGKYSCNGSETEGSRWSQMSDAVTLTVSDSRSDGLKPIITGVTAGLTVSVLIIVFLILLWRYRNNKGGRSQSPSTVSQQQNNSQTSDQKHSEAGYNTLLSDSVSESTEHIYAEIELESTKKQKKKKENKENKTESPDCFYSKLMLQTDQGAGSSDVIHAQVN
ncbi:Fc receptor-like protein 5 [Labeo rohita]|uniref:Fc receptor-like protein 5 n=1 Tax=Labeo rohita TaxID=84645 RepID=A0ABQ8L5T2_LABRO|nr:Fc receptor-like protein 5 [Labeo rohita]